MFGGTRRIHKAKERAIAAFREDYSILTNAKAHVARRYVLNLDLEDFFPSLNFGRVRGFFMKNNDFKLAGPVATLLAQIACNNDVLPQGSPCSPIISELLTHFLDSGLQLFLASAFTIPVIATCRPRAARKLRCRATAAKVVRSASDGFVIGVDNSSAYLETPA